MIRAITPNWTEEVFIIFEIQTIQAHYTYKIKDLNDEEIKGGFYEQELQKAKATNI